MRVRRFLSLSLACLIAMTVDWFFSFSHSMLIPISTLVVMLTSVGNLILQSLVRYIGLLFIVIGLTWFFSSALIEARVYDVTLGALIGITCNFLLFSRRTDEEFREAILPILLASENYYISLSHFIFEKNESDLEDKKKALEVALQSMPLWVFYKGFDHALKPGHQFFLTKIQHIAEILFSIHFVIRDAFSRELLLHMKDTLNLAHDKMKLIFAAIIIVCQLKKLTEGVDDAEAELHALDHQFQRWLPINMALLTLPDEEVRFFAVIYGLMDLREALIRLSQSLR